MWWLNEQKLMKSCEIESKWSGKTEISFVQSRQEKKEALKFKRERKVKSERSTEKSSILCWSNRKRLSSSKMGNYCSSSQKKDKDNVSEKSEEWVFF